MSSVGVVIPAMDCPHEFALIEPALRKLAGVRDVVPNYVERSVRVEFDAELLETSTILATLGELGFPGTLIAAPTSRREAHRAAWRKSWLGSLGPGALLLAAALLVAMRSGATASTSDAGGVAPSGATGTSSSTTMTGSTTKGGDPAAPRPVSVVVLVALATLTAGWPVFAASLRALRLGRLDMNSLMTLAACGALITAPRTGEWFEAPVALWLFGFALWLEDFSLDRAGRAVESLVELAPAVAHRVRASSSSSSLSSSSSEAEAEAETHADYDTDDVSLDRLAIGDRVLVKPGERMPVDGRVVSGSSAVNQAPITGESLPVEKRTGDDVFAGSLNGDGPLVIAATRTAAGSTLAQIERLIEQARSSRAPTERFVDRFARWYTPTVMALAVSVAILPALAVWAGIVEPSVDMTRYLVEWLHRGLVLLVIACPCALVISTPLTITCGLHQATRLGVVVKGGGPLEQLAQIETVAFDKTGTLTSARPQVLAVHAAPGFDQREVLAAAAGLEAASEHPLAAAVMAEASRRGVSIERADELTIARGAGVVGRWRGTMLTVGSRRFVRESCGIDLADPSDATDQPGEPSPAALAGEIVVAEAGRVWGTIQCEDRVRPEARAALKQLRQLGVTPLVMLTGDSWPAARRAAESLELAMADVRAELLPQRKVDEVRRLATDGRVAVALVGDGVNDAPALAAARIGIAFGSGASDTALETADVVVLNNDLQTVPRLVKLARTVRRLLRQNIALALGLKLAVLLLTFAGMASLWSAVAADVGASLTVIANGMRSLRREP